MSPAVALAAGAAIAAVGAAWSAIGAAEHGLASLVVAIGPDGRLGRALAPLRADRDASESERRRLLALAAAALLGAGWLLAGPPAGLALAAAAPLLASRALAARRRRRREALADAAPAVARAIADALGAGHSIRGSLREAARCGGLERPVAGELQAVAAALALGEPTERVLERWRARAAQPAYDALIAAIMLQREAGGDLARLLRDLAAALEEHVRARADARALTAQARFTAQVVAALPLVAALLAELGRPGYLVALLANPLGGALVSVSAILQLAAWIAVRRIARVAR